MDKRYLSPAELLTIATAHAYSAEHLLQQKNPHTSEQRAIDALTPVTTLLYKAFLLTLKAYALHEHRPVKQCKNLRELLAVYDHLGFSKQDLQLLKTLSLQQVFSKGLGYDLWDDHQHLHIFCEKLLDLYQRLQQMMPLELDKDYQ